MSKEVKEETIPKVEIPREKTAEYKLRKALRKHVPPLTGDQVKEIVQEVVYGK